MHHLSLIKTRTGNYSLKVNCEDGSEKLVHSMYDPGAEAGKIVDGFEFDGKGIIVVLGLGLGYHVAGLIKKFPGAKFIVVEAMTEIYKLAMQHGPAIEAKVDFMTGIPADDVIREITRHQMKDGIVPLSVFALPSLMSAFPSYYQPILASLKKTVSIKLWDRLRYIKFKQDKQKVLLIDTGYFLVREAEKALKALGHDVLRVPVEKRGTGETIISSFVDAVVNFKPDFLLTLNHLGFDEDGVLTDFFKSIEMPVASWYVDSPRLIVHAFDKNVSPWTSLFLWDKSYMKEMEAMGFESVGYLPLGTDETVFKQTKNKGHGSGGKGQGQYSCDVGFVGNSMVGPVNEWMAKVAPVLHPAIEKAAEHIAFSGKPDGDIMTVLSETDRKGMEGLTGKDKMDFEAAVLWKATLLYRLSCIEMLKDFGPMIHGDNGWRDILAGKNIQLYPPLNYYKDLPHFFNACKINFNATSRQMKEAVNQRVFDVPACGAFLLTDYQKGLEELFDAGKEIITYKHKDEIPGLVRFYLDNPHEREAVAKRARERVLKEHTYGHRLDKLIGSMKKRYKHL